MKPPQHWGWKNIQYSIHSGNDICVSWKLIFVNYFIGFLYKICREKTEELFSVYFFEGIYCSNSTKTHRNAILIVSAFSWNPLNQNSVYPGFTARIRIWFLNDILCGTSYLWDIFAMWRNLLHSFHRYTIEKLLKICRATTRRQFLFIYLFISSLFILGYKKNENRYAI